MTSKAFNLAVRIKWLKEEIRVADLEREHLNSELSQATDKLVTLTMNKDICAMTSKAFNLAVRIQWFKEEIRVADLEREHLNSELSQAIDKLVTFIMNKEMGVEEDVEEDETRVPMAPTARFPVTLEPKP